MPRTQMLSLMAMGIPASAGIEVPSPFCDHRLLSISSARAQRATAIDLQKRIEVLVESLRGVY